MAVGGQAESFQLCFKALNECQGGWVGGQFASPNPVSDPISESWLARGDLELCQVGLLKTETLQCSGLLCVVFCTQCPGTGCFFFLTTEAEVGLSSL